VLKCKSGVGARPVGKCAKVPGHKTVPSKMLVAPKSVGATSTKAASAKATHAKSTLRASVLPKAGPPLGGTVSEITAMVTTQRAGVLKISVRTKRPTTASSPTAKGKKKARIDARSPSASAATLKTLVRP
jgi:hypothetical protein